MFHQSLTGHDPWAFFAADDDFASEGAFALGTLVGNDFFVVVTLTGALSVTSCHDSPFFHRAGCSKHCAERAPPEFQKPCTQNYYFASSKDPVQ